MIKVVVATHKEYRMPEDQMYLPLHVGAELSDADFGYEKDNTGENISSLNRDFCELTGLYWAWKNLDADYIGLVHYRRHFSLKKKGKDPFDSLITHDEIEPYLGKIKVFVPKKRNYYIETLYSHYAHTHYANHLDETKNILQEKCPDYVPYCDKVFDSKSGYMFNMMIMKTELLDSYCTWLFDILFELKKRIPEEEVEQMSAFQRRFYGRVSEILFNVWLSKQINDGTISQGETMELKCVHMEKVNWFKKGKAFLAAKFTNKKYEGSF